MMMLLVSLLLTAFGQVKASSIEDDVPKNKQSKHRTETHYQGDYYVYEYDWFEEPVIIHFEDVSLSRKERRKRYLFIPPIKYLGVHFRNTA